MALIKDREGRKDGGYERLFGDRELGHLISRVQAAVISAGTELEKIIKGKVDQIEDLDKFLDKETMPEGVYLAGKHLIKKSSQLNFGGSEPDFIVFKRRNNQQHCYLVELKDGDTFDTKKAAGELASMESFISQNAQNLPYRVTGHFCCFNQNSREEIVKGFKSKIATEHAMTGKEFCTLLEINYDEIVESRKPDQQQNLRYFVEELMKIDAVRELINRSRD